MLTSFSSRIRILAAMAVAMMRTPYEAITAGHMHGTLTKPTRKPAKARAKRKGSTPWGSSGWKRTQAQEMARRVRQIAAGTLTISNGLVVPGLKYLGHGKALHIETQRVITV